MRKPIAGIVTATLAVAVGLSGCGDSGTETPSPTPTASSTPTNGTDSGSASMQASVSIQNVAFDPNQVTVAPGGTVTWTNDDSTAHNVIFDDASVTSSGTLDEGATFSATFPEAGEYNYVCTFHPGMRGTVTVTG